MPQYLNIQGFKQELQMDYKMLYKFLIKVLLMYQQLF